MNATSSQHAENSIEVSVVVPAYNEEGNIVPLYQALLPVLETVTNRWEIIITDDGSQDQTWKTVCGLVSGDARVRGIRLSRNFGHQRALLAGLYEARGQAVVTMDADMQHPPDVIPDLVDRWRRGARIVHTVRRDSRSLPLFKRLSSKAFYPVFSYLSGVMLSQSSADFRLIDHFVLSKVLAFRDQDLFLRGAVQWVGFETATVEFQSSERLSGISKYTLRRMLKFAWHGVTGFSIVPLRMAIGLGLVSSGVSFFAVVYAILSKVWAGQAVPGWTSTLAIVAFLFGTLFIFLAILGEYVGRVLVEVRGRPRFLVSERAEGETGSSAR